MSNDFGDLLTLIDSDRIHADDSATVKAAILADGQANGGSVDPNRVRKMLTNEHGLTVYHRTIGAAYYALRTAGLIERDGITESDDKAGRNAGRIIRTYRLTEAGARNG